MRRITLISLLVLTALVIAYDFVAYWIGGSEATISRVIGEGSYTYPVISFLAGLVSGHLWWVQGSIPGKEPEPRDSTHAGIIPPKSLLELALEEFRKW